MDFSSVLAKNKIQYIVTVPDSLSSKLIKKEQLVNRGIRYIHALNELSAVSISSGLNLTGERAVCVIENSGIRFACDVITRFELCHKIHNMYMITGRGSIGEENWWGIFHESITNDIISNLPVKWCIVNSFAELETAVDKSVKSFTTEQVSTIIILSSVFFEGLK